MRPRQVGRAMYAISRSALRHPFDFLKYLGRQGATYERYRLVGSSDFDRAVDAIVDARMRPFLNSPPALLLPQRSLEEICPGAADPPDWHPESGDGSELPVVEQRAIAAIVRAHAPTAVFEIGTYRGRTTRLLATCSPMSMVHTLDLAPENMLDGGCFRRSNGELIGEQFSSDTRVLSRITQHFGDSRLFDFRPFYGQVDLVFVDASHAYEAVLNDSREAFRMLRKGGIILWDDYHPLHGLGVMKALGEIGVEKSIVWIKGTRLAAHLMR